MGKNHIKLHMENLKSKKLGYINVIQCHIDKCPQYAKCCSNGMNVAIAMEIEFCPMCGRKLVEE